MFIILFLFIIARAQNCINDLDCRATHSLCANGRCFSTACSSNQTMCPFLNLSDTCFFRLCDQGSCITRSCTTNQPKNCTLRRDCSEDENCVLGLCIALLPCNTQSDCTRSGDLCSSGRCVVVNCLDVNTCISLNVPETVINGQRFCPDCNTELNRCELFPCLPVEAGPGNVHMDGAMIFTWILLAAIILGILIVCCCVRWKLRVR